MSERVIDSDTPRRSQEALCILGYLLRTDTFNPNISRLSFAMLRLRRSVFDSSVILLGTIPAIDVYRLAGQASDVLQEVNQTGVDDDSITGVFPAVKLLHFEVRGNERVCIRPI
jgi:hypothetical protein